MHGGLGTRLHLPTCTLGEVASFPGSCTWEPGNEAKSTYMYSGRGSLVPRLLCMGAWGTRLSLPTCTPGELRSLIPRLLCMGAWGTRLSLPTCTPGEVASFQGSCAWGPGNEATCTPGEVASFPGSCAWEPGNEATCTPGEVASFPGSCAWEPGE